LTERRCGPERAKSNGSLTKHIFLRNGKLVSDSSACRMASGVAWRVKVASVQELADLINGFNHRQAYALGRLKDGLPDSVRVVRKDQLNGVADPCVIARSREFLTFKEGEGGFVLFDLDLKGMSETVRTRIKEYGGLWGALCEVLPALKSAAQCPTRLDQQRLAKCQYGRKGRRLRRVAHCGAGLRCRRHSPIPGRPA
jgi:hypothetical protein